MPGTIPECFSQSEAFALADRVIIMNEGVVVQVGSPKEIYRAPSNRFVAEFVGTVLRIRTPNGTLVLEIDVDKPRTKTVKTVTIPDIALIQDDPPMPPAFRLD